MKTKRNIPVKTNFDADLYTAFDAACGEAVVSHSKQLYDLASAWVARRNDKCHAQRADRPKLAPNRAMFLPGRTRFAGNSMSLRM